MVGLDLSIVNIAFPAISRSFPSTSRAGLSWVLTGYSLVFGALLLAGGRTADRVGRKRTFFLGIGVFSLGSALCGLAPSVALLVGGRVLQGAGAAFVLPASLGLLLAGTPPTERPRVVSMWGAVSALAVATGPSLGAVLVDGPGWRWAFYINLPVALLAWLAGRRAIAESREPATAGRPDLLGVGMAVAAVGGLALGIVEGHEWGWGDGRVVVAFVAAALLFPALIARSARHPQPVVDLTLFRQRTFTVANLATFFYAVGFFAMLLGNVLFLTSVWHYSVLRAGLAITPGPVVVVLFAGTAGKLAGRYGFRPVLMSGATLFALGEAWLVTRVGPASSYLGRWLPATILVGFGIAFTFPVLSAAAVSGLPPARLAIGSAVNQTSRQIGAVLGVALLVVILGSPRTPSQALNGFRHLWMFAASTALVSGLVSSRLARKPRAAADLAPAAA